jgi:hypothetical protein
MAKPGPPQPPSFKKIRMGCTSLSLKYAAICSVAAGVTSSMVSSLLFYSTARHLSFQDLRRITRRIGPISMSETRSHVEHQTNHMRCACQSGCSKKYDKKKQLPETQMVVNLRVRTRIILHYCHDNPIIAIKPAKV